MAFFLLDDVDKKLNSWLNASNVNSVSSYNPFVWYTAGLGAAVLAAAAYYACRAVHSKSRVVPLTDLDNQSESVEADQPHWRRTRLLDAKKLPLRYLDSDVLTVHGAIRHGERKAGANAPCLGWRVLPTTANEGGSGATVSTTAGSGYQWLSYGEVLRRSQHMAIGMVKLGLQPVESLPSAAKDSATTRERIKQKLTCVGIYAKNRPEWCITEYACYCYNMTLVPIYDTLGPDACRYICSQAGIALCVCDSLERLEQLLEMQAKGDTRLRIFVVMDDFTVATASDARDAGMQAKRKKFEQLTAEHGTKASRVLTMRQLEALGATEQMPARMIPPSPYDICTICYTSGTTGLPKGVVLTHENVISAVAAVSFQLGVERPSMNDCIISFLPLAHMLQRCCEIAYLMQGGRIGYYSGDIRNLADDLAALKPNCCAAVPRLLNRIHDDVYSRVQQSRVKRALLAIALFFKRRQLQAGIIRRDTIWDKLVFHRIQERMGGNLRLLLTGSAPLDSNVLTFIRCALGCTIVEGYGQTECSAPCSLTLYGDWRAGHVGPPIACNTVKLVDVPDMNICVERDGMGEVCVQGSNVFQGYYGGDDAEERTREVLDADGFLHTGDVGQWTQQGTLRIVDRCKHMFKLSQGEYIVPDKTEAVYQRQLVVAQAYLYGEPLRSTCVALFVADEQALRKLLRKLHLEDEAVPGVGGAEGALDLHYMANKSTFAELCNDKRVAAVVLERVNKFARSQGVTSFALAKAVRLLPEPFTVENGLLSPTMKVKRHDVKLRYAADLKQLYADLQEQETQQQRAAVSGKKHV